MRLTGANLNDIGDFCLVTSQGPRPVVVAIAELAMAVGAPAFDRLVAKESAGVIAANANLLSADNANNCLGVMAVADAVIDKFAPALDRLVAKESAGISGAEAKLFCSRHINHCGRADAVLAAFVTKLALIIATPAVDAFASQEGTGKIVADSYGAGCFNSFDLDWSQAFMPCFIAEEFAATPTIDSAARRDGTGMSCWAANRNVFIAGRSRYPTQS